MGLSDRNDEASLTWVDRYDNGFDISGMTDVNFDDGAGWYHSNGHDCLGTHTEGPQSKR